MYDVFCKDNEKKYRCKKLLSIFKNDCEYKMILKIYI